MSKFTHYAGQGLPVPIFKNTGLLDEFLAHIHLIVPVQTGFVTAEIISSVAAVGTQALVNMGLMYTCHPGAIFRCIVRGGDPASLVRPVAELQLRRKKTSWILENFSFGNLFSMEPTRQGITLTGSQQAILLRQKISKSPRELHVWTH